MPVVRNLILVAQGTRTWHGIAAFLFDYSNKGKAHIVNPRGRPFCGSMTDGTGYKMLMWNGYRVSTPQVPGPPNREICWVCRSRSSLYKSNISTIS